METRQFSSPSELHVLRIEPNTNRVAKPGFCKATLTKVEGIKSTEVWSRYLINNHGPVNAFVSDSGEYVITMDEWHRVGELPVVIYGHDGSLIKVHSTESLGLEEDIFRIKMTSSSYWWNEDSVSFFDPSEKYFLIRLHWGKWIVLDLSSGNLFVRSEKFYRDDLKKEHEEKWAKLDKFKKDKLAERAFKMLGSSEPEERKTGAMICGQEGLKKAIPALKGLLKDKETYLTGQGQSKAMTRVYYVRKIAKEALEKMGVKAEGIVIEEPE